MINTENKKIILFDGVCNLCNSSVTFVIKRDAKDVFRFAALQEEPGQKLINQYGIDINKTDSIILIENNKAFTKSTAALRIARHLGGAYPLLYGFMIIPVFIRNWVYDYVAKNRYKWYGKKESCMIPTPELKSKFL
ncbi:thiol-disulfide oxidoreductase DCC family protein [Patiriisocius hiemis]|uniref:Thiol-disulfide oxidoreductase DCC family protein n=1 Tax=Patiriisocius hiemis TaxID=3075604 RepID=A0ABU2Y9E7_9FLAO|nr:thiol-disulfide oxidoreductase DCC family protein [Constantimarinum sp. W242]MDT0554811.1 thiol-disulfide oxidoreductase DCC family protein [Constantimarinum sp. W242]